MPRQKKISTAKGYHKVISTGNGEFANYNKVVQAFGNTGSGRGLLRHSINEAQGPREYERMENILERPPPRPKLDPLLTELSNLNPDSGSSHHDFDSDDRSDISHVDKQGNTRSWLNSAASFNPRKNYHGAGWNTRYGVDNTQYHSHPRDQDIMMSKLEYQLHLKERQLAFTTSIVEQQNRFLYEQLDGFMTMPPMKRLYPDTIDKRSVRLKPNKLTDKDLLPTKPETAKKKHKKTKIDSTEKELSDRLLESEANNGSSEKEKCSETNVPDKTLKPRKKKQYEEIKLESMLKIAEDVCQQGCPYCYIERFGNLEEYSNHLKQKSHINVKKLSRKRSDTIIKELVYNNSRPNTENSLEFIQTVEGYYCQLCQLFFNEEVEAKVNHCKTETHNILYKNLIDNSDAIEKALADKMIKTHNQNLNGTEDVTTQHSSSLIDSTLSQDIRDLCLDKLEEVLAEKEQMSQRNCTEYNSVMFTECSDLEKGFFAEQEVRGDIPVEVYPSVSKNRNSRTLVKKRSRSFDTMNDLKHVSTNHDLSSSRNVKASNSLKTSTNRNVMDISLPYTLSNTNAQCDTQSKYYGTFQNKKESDDQDEVDSISNENHDLMIRKETASSNDDLTNRTAMINPQKDTSTLSDSHQTSTAKTDLNDSLPYRLPSTGSQYDMKYKYYASFQDRKKPTNDSSSNSDDEYALTNIKEKVTNEGFTTDAQNSTLSPQQFITKSDALNNHRKKCTTYKGVQKSAHEKKLKDPNCIQYPSDTSTEEVSKTNNEEDEDLHSDGYDTDSNSVASSHTDVSNTTSTDNVNRDSTTCTNSCLSEIDDDKSDDINELDTTLKEDSICYKCLKEFEETSDLGHGKSTAVKTTGDNFERKKCAKTNVLPEIILKSCCLMENYTISQDGLEHKNSLIDNHDEKSIRICDISLYSDCGKQDDQHIAKTHVKELDPIVTNSNFSENRIVNRNDLKNEMSTANDSDKITPHNNITKYSISVQKDLDLLTSDMDLLPSTSFNYTTALDFDINSNFLVEHTDFEVDGFVENEGIPCRNILTQTYNVVTLYDSSYIGDEDHLMTEEIEVNTEREPPDGIEDKRHKLQSSSIRLESIKNNCFVAGTTSLQDINFTAVDLDRKELSDDISNSASNSQTHVDCEALIHVIDSVIGDQGQTTEKMILDAYNQPVDISGEEDSDRLDMACGGDENLDLSNTYSQNKNEDDQLSGEKSNHQCDLSKKNMLPAFEENKDDSGITDDYDEGYICPRNSPHLWARLISQQNQSDTLEKETENTAPKDSSANCDTAEWMSSQESNSNCVGLYSIDTMDNICCNDHCKEEMEAAGTPLQCISQLLNDHCDIEEFGEESTAQTNKDLFVEETDIIIQVRNSDITVDTSETLSIDICEDTTIETSFIENQTIDLTSGNRE